MQNGPADVADDQEQPAAIRFHPRGDAIAEHGAIAREPFKTRSQRRARSKGILDQIQRPARQRLGDVYADRVVLRLGLGQTPRGFGRRFRNAHVRIVERAEPGQSPDRRSIDALRLHAGDQVWKHPTLDRESARATREQVIGHLSLQGMRPRMWIDWPVGSLRRHATGVAMRACYACRHAMLLSPSPFPPARSSAPAWLSCCSAGPTFSVGHSGFTICIGVSVLAGIGAAIWTARRRERQRRERLRVMLHRIDAAIIMTDRRGVVTSMNVAAESLTGWKKEAEAIGLPVRAVFRLIDLETRRPVVNPVVKALYKGIVLRTVRRDDVDREGRRGTSDSRNRGADL